MFGVFPIADEPFGEPFPGEVEDSGFVRVINSPQEAGQYLVEIDGFKGELFTSGTEQTFFGSAPIADMAIGDIRLLGTGSGTNITLRFADRDWIGAPTDTEQPNVYYEGRVIQPLTIDRTMPLLPESRRRVQRQFGEIVIANGDGALDATVRDVAVDGRDIRVLFGPYFDDFMEFGRIANVVGLSWATDDTTVRLRVRDRSFDLELPLQDDLYSGAGGENGTADLEGKPKPLAFGKLRNVRPVLLDPTNLIYQFHDGSVKSVDAVYDRGAELTDSGTDVADYSTLVGTSVSAGEFATALAAGMFKLGATPDGLVTCDLQGDNTPDYQNTIDTIALRILKDRAGIADSNVDSGSFADLPVSSGVIGIYISHQDAPSTGEVLDKLVATVAGFWGSARNGRIFAGRISDPADAGAVLSLNRDDILRLEPDQAPVPRKRQRIAYQPNWTTQRGEDIAASVTAARRQFLAEPFRQVDAFDSVVDGRHLNALDPPALVTLYDSSADAQTLADFLLALHREDRRIFRVSVKRVAYQIFLGDVIKITWPRLGLSGGKKFVVIAIREDASRDETELRLWG